MSPKKFGLSVNTAVANRSSDEGVFEDDLKEPCSGKSSKKAGKKLKAKKSQTSLKCLNRAFAALENIEIAGRGVNKFASNMDTSIQTKNSPEKRTKNLKWDVQRKIVAGGTHDEPLAKDGKYTKKWVRKAKDRDQHHIMRHIMPSLPRKKKKTEAALLKRLREEHPIGTPRSTLITDQFNEEVDFWNQAYYGPP